MTTTNPQPVEEGRPRREGRGFVTSFGSGRTCAAAGCTTKLSRYNDESRCFLHDDAKRRA